ncbi:MAG TPA: hypothetical protein VNE39_07735, partial [Planctomycetota bacterium]|nr:hypothetical protein [Planctomycetota bacterium]
AAGTVGQAVGGGRAGAAGALLGGGGGGGGPAAPLDAVLADISTAGSLANKSPIAYKDLHKAGKDLRQYRCDYREVAAKLASGYLKPGDAGPLASIPGVGGVMQQVTGYLFMAFDIYAAMYFLVREKAEPAIAKACHDMTLRAIEGRFTRVFPVWFRRASDDAVAAEQPEEAPDNVVEEAIQKVNKAIQTVRDRIEEARRKVQDLLGIETGEPMAGEDALGEAFGALGEAQEGVLQAFRVVSGWSSPPEFLEDVMGEIASTGGGMLQAIYRTILLDKGQKPIDQGLIVAAGRVYLIEKLVGLVAELSGLSFLQPDTKLVGISGIGDVTGKQVTDKIVGLLDSAIGEKIEFIVVIAAKDLADKLESARKDALKNKSLTMEVFLGRLPWFYTLLFRNTFFPVWDILVEEVFGRIGGPLAGALSPVKSIFGSVKGGIENAIQSADDAVMGAIEDGANAVKGAAEDAKKAMGSAGVSLDLPDAVEDPMKALGLGGDDEGGGQQEQQAPPFPGSPRLTSGKGNDVVLEDVNEVESTQKVQPQPKEDDKDW